MKRRLLLFIVLVCTTAMLLCSCATTQYNPGKKYNPEALRQDFVLMKNVLEAKHPALYWYTPKDSMDNYFHRYYSLITDSMTEVKFAWTVLAPMVDKINCGHTTVAMSKAYSNAVKNLTLPSFPYYVKVWKDSMVVTGAVSKDETKLKRGTIIKTINGNDVSTMVHRMFNYLPQDGYANNINYIRLSNNFPYYHRNVYGLSQQYKVEYLDSTLQLQHTVVKTFMPAKDSLKQKDSAKVKIPKPKKPTRKELLERIRNFEVDSTGTYAYMELNGFSKGNQRSFFRRSFRTLKEKNINNFVLDVRNNGGGRVSLYKRLTQYLTRTPFKVADSLYAKSRDFGGYTGKVKGGFFNNIWMWFITKKQADGNYHIRRLERKYFKLKSANHFSGKLYVITSGPTFSAAALLVNALKGQQGVTVVGEETGGGWYGNSGIVIPDVTLPNTQLRFRMPMFRLVQWQHERVPVRGMGIAPDVYVGPSYEAIVQRKDAKMEWVIKAIFSGRK